MVSSRIGVTAALAVLVLASCTTSKDVPLVLVGTVPTTTTTTTIRLVPVTTTTTTTIVIPEARLTELPWILEPDLRALHDKATAMDEKAALYRLEEILPEYGSLARSQKSSADAHFESIIAVLPYDKYAAWPVKEKYDQALPDLELFYNQGLYTLERCLRARVELQRRNATLTTVIKSSDTPVRTAESFARAEETSLQALKAKQSGALELVVDAWLRAGPLYEFAGHDAVVQALRLDIKTYAIDSLLSERWASAEQHRTDAFTLWETGVGTISSPGQAPLLLENAAALMRQLRSDYDLILSDGLRNLVLKSSDVALAARKAAVDSGADRHVAELFGIGELLVASGREAETSQTLRLALERFSTAAKAYAVADGAARRQAEQSAASQAQLDSLQRRLAEAESARDAAETARIAAEAARDTALEALGRVPTIITAPAPVPQPAPAPTSDPIATARDTARNLLKEATDRQSWALLHNAVNNYPDAIRNGSAALESARTALADENFRQASDRALEALRGMEPIREFAPLPARYVVRPHRASGDSLRHISEYPFIYGDAAEWRVLYMANKAILPDPKNPNLVHPGQILTIPSLKGEFRTGTWNEKKTYHPFGG